MKRMRPGIYAMRKQYRDAVSDSDADSVLGISDDNSESSNQSEQSDQELETRNTILRGSSKPKVSGLKKSDFYGDSDDDGETSDASQTEINDLVVQSHLSNVDDSLDIWNSITRESQSEATIPRDVISFVEQQNTDYLDLEKNPELSPLLKELNELSGELKNRVLPLQAALDTLPNRKDTMMSFVEVKLQLLLNYLVNLSFYVLLKVKGHPIRGHPVIDHLARIKLLVEKLRPVESRLKVQIEHILKTGVQVESQKLAPPKAGFVDFTAQNTTVDDRKVVRTSTASKTPDIDILQAIRDEFSNKPATIAASTSLLKKRDRNMEENMRSKEAFEEDNFIRLPTNKKEKEFIKKSRLEKAYSLAGVDNIDDLADFGDQVLNTQQNAQKLGDYLNSAKQMTMNRKSKSDSYVDVKPAKRNNSPLADTEEHIPKKSKVEVPALISEAITATKLKNQERSAFRAKESYAERKPAVEATAEGSRIAGFDIEKNKGLIRKRKKEDRNARVKNRNKFEKAQKRRKGQVQDTIRTSDDHGGISYGGETSGLKTKLKKSTRLG